MKELDKPLEFFHDLLWANLGERPSRPMAVIWRQFMLDSVVKEELEKVVGSQWVLTEPEDLILYSYDAFMVERKPDAVIVPGSTTEVSEILKIADRERINIIPRGSGTNLSGNAIARKGGLIVAFYRMNKILEIDAANRLAVVQPGVINFDLQTEAGKQGLMWGPDPASWKISTIGGNVALNAGGPRAAKYGVTGQNLMGLEVVSANGKIIRTGGKIIKDVTGYNLTQLFCGSEGTLGIITEIVLKLIPVARCTATLQAVFSNLGSAGRTVAAIATSSVTPKTMELIDKNYIDMYNESMGKKIFHPDADTVLLIEVDGDEEPVLRAEKEVDAFCRKMGAIEVQKARTPEQADALWTARRSLYGVAVKKRPHALVEDATVPVDRFPDLLLKTVEIAEKYNLMIATLGHAGDGNLHPTIMCDLNDKDEMARIDKALDEFFEATVEMGGTLSGEHGIGLAKAKWMEVQLQPTILDFQRGIKKVFDPNGILNPGGYF